METSLRDSVLRRYYSPSQLLQFCEEILHNFSPAADESPLDDLLALLAEQREYFWIGIYFVIGDKVVREAMHGPTPSRDVFQLGKGDVGVAAQDGLSKVIPDVCAEHTYSGFFREVKSQILLPIRIGSRTLAVLNAQSERLNGFGHADRVLLQSIAELLARFLTAKGKLLVRHATERRTLQPRARYAAAQ